MYETKCPSCGDANQLEVIGGSFSAQGMYLSEDGFSFTDADQVDTEEETVRCSSCGKMFSLADLHREDPPQKDKRLRVKE